MTRNTVFFWLALQAAVLSIIGIITTAAAAAAPLTFQGGSSHFGATHTGSSRPIVDAWTFTLDTPATANASLISIALSAGHSRHAFKIDSADLIGDGFAAAFERMPAATTNPQVWTLQPTFLTAGDYAIRVTGYVPASAMSGSYGGNFNVSPVPEPSALALAAAGLVAVSWVARRRTKATFDQ